MRPSGRKTDQMRKVSFERNFSKHAERSCLVKFGDTHVLVTASLEDKTPPWLRNSGKGWSPQNMACCHAPLMSA